MGLTRPVAGGRKSSQLNAQPARSTIRTCTRFARHFLASLLGLSSVDQVKRKLIESAISGVASNGGMFDEIKSLFKAGVTAASQHYRAMADLKDLNMLLMAPVVLRDKVVVIDDIESKYAKLGIEWTSTSCVDSCDG